MDKGLNEKDVAVIMRKLGHLEEAVNAMTIDQNDRFYTVDQFYKLTGISPDTITQYCQDEILAATKIGAKWRILASEFKRLVTEAMANKRNSLRRTARRDATILNHLGYLKN